MPASTSSRPPLEGARVEARGGGVYVVRVSGAVSPELAKRVDAEILSMHGGADYGVVLAFAAGAPEFDSSMVRNGSPQLSGRVGAIVTSRATLRMIVAAVNLRFLREGRRVKAFADLGTAVDWVTETLAAMSSASATPREAT